MHAHPRRARRRLTALAVGASASVTPGVTAMAMSTVATATQCVSCGVPESSELPFCSSFVGYSACRTRSSWRDMDAAAEAQYDALVNGSTALQDADVGVDGSCALALQRTQCAAVFSVCEMGTPESLCLASCTDAIETNCSATLDDAHVAVVVNDACGDTTTLLAGVSDGGKCFSTSYDGPARSAWVAGFVIAVVFSFLASVGINLQKKALKQSELGPTAVPAYRLPLWCLGFVLILTGSILDFVAFGLAPQSLLAPLAALTLVWNMILAPCFNKEKLSGQDLAATLVIFLGATLAVVFASHASPAYSLAMLMALYKDPLTVAYFCVVALTVVAHYAAIQMVEKLCLTSRRHRVLQVGKPATWATVRLVAYAGLAGTLGGQSVLFAKSCAELLKPVFHGDLDCFLHVQGYCLAVALVACLLCQVHFLNGALVDYDALSVVPVYQAYWIITGVLGGVVYFQEIRSFSLLQAVMFVLGITTTILGVVLLSRRKHAPSGAASAKKFVLERGFSFTSSSADASRLLEPPRSADSRLPRVAEGLEAATDAAQAADAEHASLAAIRERTSDESATEESDEDERRESADADADADVADTVNRQVMANYVDMSATLCLSELLGGLGFQGMQQSGLFGRRNSGALAQQRRAAARRSVDDIELGLPAATRQANPRESVPKRRSITFTGFRAEQDKSTSGQDASS